VSPSGSVREKLKSRGWIWFWRRLIKEWRDPETRPGKLFRRAIKPIYGIFAVLRGALPVTLLGVLTARRDTVYLFYDLEVLPVTFDSVDHLAWGEMERRRLGCRYLHLVFVPGRHKGVREEASDYDAVVDVDRRLWRVHNVLAQLGALVPSCSGYTICANRAHAALLRLAVLGRALPKGNWPGLPWGKVARHEVFARARAGEAVFPIVTPPPAAMAFVRQWLEQRARGRRVIVVTTRESGYMPLRNSRVADWIAFARRLDPEVYFPVFVREVDTAMSPAPEFEGLAIFEPGPWNLILRGALYAQAWLNIAQQTGPLELVWYNHEARYCIFMPVDKAPQASEAYLKFTGIEMNVDFPFATPLQRIVWGEDTLTAIEAAFAEMAAEIVSYERLGSPSATDAL